MDESHVEVPVRPGPNNWQELLTTCPHIAKHIFKCLKVEDALKCREVFPEWELVVVNCKQLTARAKKIPLWRAAENGHLKTVEFLIGQGEDVNSAKRRKTSLMRAANGGHYNTARLLIEHGADVDAKDRLWETALCKAAQKGQFDIARLLIENGADINASNNFGSTLLMIAARHNRLQMAEFLVRNGADVNRSDQGGKTALLYATSFDVLKLLLEKGANDNATDKYGLSVMMTIVAQTTVDDAICCLELLIARGANVNTTCNQGLSALLLAIYHGHWDIAKFLIANGADVNLASTDGFRPLNCAVRCTSGSPGKRKVVELLISKGADVNARDEYGRSALKWARWDCNAEMEQLLIEKGAIDN